MKLFREKLDRLKYGTLLEQKRRGIINDFTEEIVNGQKVWNILGNLEIKPEDLDKDGKFPFKIGALSGDLILYSREYDESIIPDQMGGNIIFKKIEPEEEDNCVSSVDSDINSTEKIIDWEERHFQICLALLSRTDLHYSYHIKIIKTADRMIELLKEHSLQANKEE